VFQWSPWCCTFAPVVFVYLAYFNSLIVNTGESLRFLREPKDLNTKLRNILDGGNLMLSSLTWEHGN
jgi:hypothetical protein